MVIRRFPASALHNGLTVDAAVDSAWAIASPETYELLVSTAGRTLDDYEKWVAETLSAVLLAAPA